MPFLRRQMKVFSNLLIHLKQIRGMETSFFKFTPCEFLILEIHIYNSSASMRLTTTTMAAEVIKLNFE